MSRLFTPPKRVRVEADPAGEPATLTWRGRREPVAVSNRWRVEDDWWRQGGKVLRAYYKLRAPSGLICVVFRDETTGNWYLERILD